jgi:hypothetical protein
MERTPFLFMGILCWLCGAVVVGVGAQVLAGTGAAVLAVLLVTVLVLAVFLMLGDALLSVGKTGGKT